MQSNSPTIMSGSMPGVILGTANREPAEQHPKFRSGAGWETDRRAHAGRADAGFRRAKPCDVLIELFRRVGTTRSDEKVIRSVRHHLFYLRTDGMRMV